jgi:hypothetical protein
MFSRQKNNKFFYYVTNLLRLLVPGVVYRMRLRDKLAQIWEDDGNYIWQRVNYYNGLSGGSSKLASGTPISRFKIPHDRSAYYFDSFVITRYFDPRLLVRFVFGDVTRVPEEPSIVKSRPIAGDHRNSVLLKLNKIRHFIFVSDLRRFEDKKNLLVWRGKVARSRPRLGFLTRHFGNPLCDVGQVSSTAQNPGWIVPPMTIDEQLEFKFILSLEGNDVASNLKWIMSSHSIAVMPTPKYETWFMEGTLIPDFHYIHIKDDFSDLEEKLRYYLAHTDEALKIVKNANRYVDQFRDQRREELISLMVMNKYFHETGQL